MQKLKSLLIFNLVSIIIGCSFTLLYDYYQRNKLAEFIITSQRNNIIVRDIAAFAGEISALSEIFFQVKVVEPLNEVSLFKVDGSVHPQFTIKISKKIFNNKSLSDKIFDVDFYYSLKQPLAESILLWVLIGLALSPIFLFIQNKNNKRQEIENESKINSKYAELARQVAHDIRSPLTALQVITNKVQNSNAEEYELINEVFNRITKIADNLLDSTRKKENVVKTADAPTFEIGTVLNSIIKEKNLVLNDEIKITFDPNTQNEIFCLGEKIDFQGLFSNIIQNAIEAKSINNNLLIDIFLREYKNQIEITIMDNGCGIPEEIVKKLTTKGFTYNKPKGNGLGLYHAKKYLLKWGGDLKIISQLNSGTQVSLKLRKA